MRQKYHISRKATDNTLRIVEYKAAGKPRKKSSTSSVGNASFSVYAEETYDSAVIVNAIQHGLDDLIDTLRTGDLFPFGPYAIKIAESVIELYDSEEDGSVELSFDDRNLIEDS